MKKLRLLITEQCNRNCKLCVNKQYNLAKLHVESHISKYKEIILTGGEPMLDVNYLIEVIEFIKDHVSVNTKIWLHTAKVDDIYATLSVLDLINGLTLTIHNDKDIPALVALDGELWCGSPRWKNKSFKLCMFEGIELPELNICNWDIHHIKWLKDCPLPEGEVFKRFAYID